VRRAAVQIRLPWRETNYLLLRRGPYLIAAGLDESLPGESKTLTGRWVNLFDPELRVNRTVQLKPGTRSFLLDLDTAAGAASPRVLASAGKTLTVKGAASTLTLAVEGVANTPAIVLLHSPAEPRVITLEGRPMTDFTWSATEKLLWVRFMNQAAPRELAIQY
jgi:hypothetical protein